MKRPEVRRISVWSGPRNVSTALMYSFAQRADTRVVDEPLYGHYLKRTGGAHPGAEEVMAGMDCQGRRVVREVLLGPTPKPIIFFKNMAHHLVGLERGFLTRLTNALLIRSPREMLPSLAKNLPRPTLSDTGYVGQIEILQLLLQAGRHPPVLDSRQLLLDPEGVLSQFCQALEIPMDSAMLSWPAGPKPYDGVWARYWYDSVHRSNRFQPYRPKSGPFPDTLRPLLQESQPLYERLYEHAIKAPTPDFSHSVVAKSRKRSADKALRPRPPKV
ncbi:MAG: sulfotransferase family protein [Acidobacteriota bacterium]